jgi:hypothetical protein
MSKGGEKVNFAEFPHNLSAVNVKLAATKVRTYALTYLTFPTVNSSQAWYLVAKLEAISGKYNY